MPRRKAADDTPAEVRKAPRQSRSRSTVDSIKIAVLELGAKGGFADMTIAQIAERAGVSKGSLYQYFSGREAIFLAMFEDASAEMAAVMKELYIRILDLPPREGVTAVLRRHLDLVRRHELVLLIMPEQVPTLLLKQRPITYENMIMRFTRSFIQEKCPKLNTTEVAHRAFFIHEVARSCIQRFVEEPPDTLSDRAFLGQLTRLITDYMLKDGA